MVKKHSEFSGESIKTALLLTALNLVALIIMLVGLSVVSVSNLLLGDLIWLIGAGILIYGIYKNFKSEKDLGIVNAIIKIVILAFFLLFMLLLNLASF